MSEHLESTCATCGKTDNHPKHVVHVGSVETEVFGELKKFYHPADKDEDGYVEYHFDCDSEHHVEQDAPIIEAAKGGIHGDDLRNFIQDGDK